MGCSALRWLVSPRSLQVTGSNMDTISVHVEHTSKVWSYTIKEYAYTITTTGALVLHGIYYMTSHDLQDTASDTDTKRSDTEIR